MNQTAKMARQCPVHKVPVTEELAAQLDYVCVESRCGLPLSEVVQIAHQVRDHDAEAYERDETWRELHRQTRGIVREV